MNPEFQKQYLKDIIYRLNCMLAWDLFVHINNRYNNERSVYATGQVLEPALEVSAIFGRQLLNFLKITKNSQNELSEFIGKMGKGDLTIDCLYPSMTSFPLQDTLTRANKNDLLILIKVADKAIAHFTKEATTEEEFHSLKKARMTIYVGIPEALTPRFGIANS